MNDQAPLPTQDLKSVRQLYYILRLWRPEASHGSAWLAILVNPKTGSRIGFTSLEQMFGYILDQCECCGDLEDAADDLKT